MLVQPFIDQTERASWKRSGDNAVLNCYLSLVSVIEDMEVWRIMFAYIHIDEDSVKAANFWHVVFFLIPRKIQLLFYIFKFKNYLVYRCAKFLFTGDYFGYVSVELGDVHFLAVVLLLHV